MKEIHLIKTEEEYDKIMDEVLKLAKSNPLPEGGEYEELMILSMLIKEYDREHFSTPPSDPIEAIKFRMDQEELRPVDMIEFFGSTSRFYEVINKKRNLTLNMIKKLHKGLGIPYNCLIA